MAKIVVLKHKYRYVHCRDPRGWGCWMFQFGLTDRQQWYGPFTKARQKACAYARATGQTVVHVLP